ncbi:MAG: hypothetical protein ACJARZ_000713 [Dokdonia sp.]|jgi:hypothetical protein
MNKAPFKLFKSDYYEIATDSVCARTILNELILSITVLSLSCEYTNTANCVAIEAPIVFTPNIPIDVDPAVMKTQVKRMVDIPVRVKNINTMMQGYFEQQASVSYCQLIDTQCLLDQDAAPETSTPKEYRIPESVVNTSGGKPNLALLTNISMETFFQGGNQFAGLMENSK